MRMQSILVRPHVLDSLSKNKQTTVKQQDPESTQEQGPVDEPSNDSHDDYDDEMIKSDEMILSQRSHESADTGELEDILTPKSFYNVQSFCYETARIELDYFIEEKKLAKKAIPVIKTTSVKNIKLLQDSQESAAQLVRDSLSK